MSDVVSFDTGEGWFALRRMREALSSTRGMSAEEGRRAAEAMSCELREACAVAEQAARAARFRPYDRKAVDEVRAVAAWQEAERRAPSVAPVEHYRQAIPAGSGVTVLALHGIGKVWSW